MNIYLFVPLNASLSFKDQYLCLVKLMRESGIGVFTNLDDSCEKYAARSKPDSFFLNEADVVILDGSQSSPEIGYLVAFALTNKKPVLYLLETGLNAENNLRQLARNPNISGLLRIDYYTERSLEKNIKMFLQEIGQAGFLREVPDIKFTLRLTPSLDRYLEWKAKQIKKTKADFIREAVAENLMKSDDEYQTYLKSQAFLKRE